MNTSKKNEEKIEKSKLIIAGEDKKGSLPGAIVDST